jgi:hypothetical protein
VNDLAQVAPVDMWWFLLTSMRYSLGRESYAASLTADLIRRYGRYLTDQQVKQIAREIRDDLHMRENWKGGPLPSDIIATWQRLADELERPMSAVGTVEPKNG